MSPRRLLTAALVAALTFVGCDSRQPLCEGDDCGGAGGGGGSAGGGGGGSGDKPDAGTKPDGGTEPVVVVKVSEVRALAYCSAVHLRGVVVVGISNLFTGAKGDVDADFWVVDPAEPTVGIFVDKVFQDLPSGAFDLKLGDVLDIDAWLGNYSKYEQTAGYRPYLMSQFKCVAKDGKPMVITRKSSGGEVPVNADLPEGFGNADGGTVAANAAFAGSRIHLEGPLEITNARPLALNETQGFEVTGGVLVNDFRTRGRADGGGCDYAGLARDGGQVVFPEGIRGVWDTYTYQPCYDGGTSCGSSGRDAGYVPGTESKLTYVLYPLSCDTDFPGADAGH